MLCFLVTSSTVGICLIWMFQQQFSACCLMNMMVKILISWRYLVSVTSMQKISTDISWWKSSYIYGNHVLLFPDWQRTGWTSTGKFFYSKERGSSHPWFGGFLLFSALLSHKNWPENSQETSTVFVINAKYYLEVNGPLRFLSLTLMWLLPVVLFLMKLSN